MTLTHITIVLQYHSSPHCLLRHMSLRVQQMQPYIFACIVQLAQKVLTCTYITVVISLLLEPPCAASAFFMNTCNEYQMRG